MTTSTNEPHGAHHGTLTTGCACGSSITSAPDDESIEHAVSAHRATPEHRAWAALMQLAGVFVAAEPVALLWRLQGGERPA